MAKRKLPPALRANAARMKAGDKLVKKGGGKATPKNIKRKGGKK